MKPIFEITEEIMSLIADITERMARISEKSGADSLQKNLMLRKTNRIRTIQGSLAIEQNTLTLEQVTAVLNGKTVIAPPKDIAEVKNAYEIYDRLEELSPTSQKDLCTAHKVMMRSIADDAGEYRSIPVGVVNSKNEIVHFGTLPQYVPDAMSGLFEWLKASKAHPLIKGCVFHYEFEQIHPFSDGNGRMGRLWHTLILSKWNPLFAWLPVESMIYNNQKAYYDTINLCNNMCDSTEFIAFMLDIISSTFAEAEQVGTSQEQVAHKSEQVGFDELLAFCKIPRTRAEMQAFCNVEGRKKFVSDYLSPLLLQGKLAMTIPDKPKSSLQKYIAK